MHISILTYLLGPNQGEILNLQIKKHQNLIFLFNLKNFYLNIEKFHLKLFKENA